MIGFMVVEPSPIPSEPPKADWDGEIHPTREQANAECAQANGAGSEPYETPEEWWGVVAVVEVGAIADAEKRGAIKALRLLAAEADDLGRVYSGHGLAAAARQIESGEITL